MDVRAKLIELWKRSTEYSESEDIYLNGDDNKYPMEIERVVMNSPTASRAVDIMSKFISGSSIQGNVKLSGNRTLYDEVSRAAYDVALQNGVFIHVSFGVDTARTMIVPTDVEVLDYNKCRISKEDDEDNKGKIYYEDFEGGEDEFTGLFDNDNEKQWFYPFNDDQKVIKSQIKNDAKKLLKRNPEATLEEMIGEYRGQVFYMNRTPNYVYAISKFNSVYNDCDTEYRMGLYSNTVTREGFMGKIAVLTNNLEIEDKNSFDNDLKKWLGSENSGNIYHMEFEGAENLDDAVKIMNIESNYDDNMFVNTSKRIRENILGVANNLPLSLVFSSDSSLFGGTEGKYIQMKLFYQEQTESERKDIEKVFSQIGFKIEINELVTEEITEENADNDNTKRLHAHRKSS